MELTFDEAKAVISDKNNQHYTRYHNNDSDVNSAVSRAYLKQFPGEYDPSNSTPAALYKPPEKASGEPNNQAGPEAATSPSEVEITLKNEWGSNFDANLSHAADALGNFFGSADEFQKFLDTSNLTAAEQIEGVKLLSKIGKGKR